MRLKERERMICEHISNAQVKFKTLASFRMSISICPFPTSCEVLKDFLSNCKPFMSFSGCAEDEDPPAAMCARVSGSLFSAKERANLRRIEEIFCPFVV